MTPLQQIHQHQRGWAKSRQYKIDSKDYLPCLQHNLFATLSDSACKAFSKGSGSELVKDKSGRAKMNALHSSSALAVNFFDYWSTRDNSVLLECMELEPAKVEITFERKFPTGLGGTPPNLDVVIKYGSNSIIGVESKFTEWLTRKPKSKIPFAQSYFPIDKKLWADLGLPNCQQLVEDIRNGEELFLHLDAPQLLKHTLGLANAPSRPVRLFYIYYDFPGIASALHKKEVQTYHSRVNDEMQFTSMTYQDLFHALQQKVKDGHSKYLNYLEKRYIHTKRV